MECFTAFIVDLAFVGKFSNIIILISFPGLVKADLISKHYVAIVNKNKIKYSWIYIYFFLRQGTVFGLLTEGRMDIHSMKLLKVYPLSLFMLQKDSLK